MKSSSIAFVVLLVSRGVAMTWTDVETTLHPNADGTLPPARFAFRNDSPDPVSITEISASCGCTTVELEKRSYAPGEKGAITARLDPAGLGGEVRRTIIVSTNEAGIRPQTLTLVAELPEAISFTPRTLRWTSGEALTAKTVDVRVNQREGVLLEAAWANDPDFKVELVTVVARSHYRVLVTPPKAGGPQQALIALRASGPVPVGSKLTFSARVQ